jgi:hypothetical protein
VKLLNPVMSFWPAPRTLTASTVRAGTTYFNQTECESSLVPRQDDFGSAASTVAYSVPVSVTLVYMLPGRTRGLEKLSLAGAAPPVNVIETCRVCAEPLGVVL